MQHALREKFESPWSYLIDFSSCMQHCKPILLASTCQVLTGYTVSSQTK